MTCYVISFGTGSTTIFPPASETEIVSAFPANMCVAKVVVERFWIRERLSALGPETYV
jgi:hypothetical protein